MPQYRKEGEKGVMEMTTLNEVIKNPEEVAEEQEENAREARLQEQDKYANDCLKFAAEHRQLAEWLKDYKRLKERESCEDAISRQAAIDAIRRIRMCKCSTNEVEAVAECLRVVEALPSVQPKQNWTPVSKRLPNFNDIVLASTDSDYPELEVILTVYNGEEFWFNGKIKAWMPIPEPYEAESEE